MADVDSTRATVDELIKALSARNIMGEPIEMEDKVIIPITKMGMGFGTGQGGKEANKGVSTSGAGGGVGVFPVAVMIVFKGIAGPEGVKVIPLSSQSSITEPETGITDNIIEKIIHYLESKEKKPSHTATVDIE